MDPPTITTARIFLGRKRAATDTKLSTADAQAAMAADREESRSTAIVPCTCADILNALHVSDSNSDNDTWWLFAKGARRLLKEERVSVVVRRVELDREQARYRNTTGELDKQNFREFVVSDEGGAVDHARSLRVILFQSSHAEPMERVCAIGAGDVDYYNRIEHVPLLHFMAHPEEIPEEERNEEGACMPVALKLFGKLRVYEATKRTKLVVHRVLPIYQEEEVKFHQLQARLYKAQLGVEVTMKK